MAATIIATPGAVDANSFGTLAEADAYHLTQLHADTPWPVSVAASVALGTGANGVVTITADTPGTAGNALNVVVTLASGANQPLAASISGDDISVVLGTNASSVADATKNTATLVAAAVDALAGVSAVASGFGTSALAVSSRQFFTGGLSYDDTKIPALIMATQWMTSLIRWTGFDADHLQRLPWPREGMWRRNGFASIPPTEIPEEVKAAQFELARLLRATDRTVESDTVVTGLSSLSAGPVSLGFNGTVGQPPVVPTFVTDILVPEWVAFVSGQRHGTIDLLRG